MTASTSTFASAFTINAAMSASVAGSDYGSEFGDFELTDFPDNFSPQRALQFLGPSRQDAVASLPALLAFPTVLLDHDQDEYGWREGEVEVLEDDADVAILPLEIGYSESQDGCAY
jgi:hypothetical protein